MTNHCFEKLEEKPPDVLYGLKKMFIADPRGFKVDLGIGVYKDSDLQSILFPSIKEAERQLWGKEKAKDYSSIDGDPEYLELIQHLVFGELNPRICGAQTVGGTGALSLGCGFLHSAGFRQAYVSDPTWVNHEPILRQAGFSVGYYPYFDYSESCLDFDRMYEAVAHMVEGSVIVFQGSCHNPTGLDLEEAQWEALFNLVCERHLFVFFDFAYQGLGTNLSIDVLPLRKFLRRDVRFAVAISLSKNLGLYGERVGALYVVTKDRKESLVVSSCLKPLIRAAYASPPIHGAKLVCTVLQDLVLKKRWMADLSAVRNRLVANRQKFVASLVKNRISFRGLSQQKGMFVFTNLAKDAVARLMKEYAVYVAPGGRINISGLNAANIDYVANAVCAVCR